jgi:hypothetical protein
MATSERTKQFAPLGYTRLRIVSCLGGDMPSLPQYVKLGAGEDVFEAFRRFVSSMVQSCAADRDQLTRSLIGAARLLVGELAGADEVLDHLPSTAPTLDHGAGYCLVVPTRSLQAALPLPESLRHAPSVLAESAEQASLRGWLEEQRSRLVWEETLGQYRIANTETPSGKQP